MRAQRLHKSGSEPVTAAAQRTHAAVAHPRIDVASIAFRIFCTSKAKALSVLRAVWDHFRG
ncbi:MAG: hypothetical protein ACR2G6_15270 [Gemmatimonadaceae bacterium]